jgi:5'-nucleotidase
MILVSNDDGIHSDGLRALQEAMVSLEDTVVVAPDRERSAVSHSLTLHRPLRANEIRPGWHAVDGTPTDCVLLGINRLLSERPRIVVSGINHGPNLGDDITYSGTVSAAMEGALLGVPAIAISLDARADFHFEAAAKFAQTLVSSVLRDGLSPGTLLNVNVPGGEELPTEVVFTRQGHRRFTGSIEEKRDPRGRPYFWIAGQEVEPELKSNEEPETDYYAVRAGKISITPIHLDLTSYATLEQVRSMEIRWP